MEKHNNRGQSSQRGARSIDDLKSEGRYFHAGALAYSQGRDAAYGCHFGMRSTLETARAEFKNGWEDARIHCEVSFGPLPMTEAQARAYAAGDRHYVARPDRVGDGWHVWDCVSDHRVEFQETSNG